MSEYSVEQQVHPSDTNLKLGCCFYFIYFFQEESFGLLGTEEKYISHLLCHTLPTGRSPLECSVCEKLTAVSIGLVQ